MSFWVCYDVCVVDDDVYVVLCVDELCGECGYVCGVGEFECCDFYVVDVVCCFVCGCDVLCVDDDVCIGLC